MSLRNGLLFTALFAVLSLCGCQHKPKPQSGSDLKSEVNKLVTEMHGLDTEIHRLDNKVSYLDKEIGPLTNSHVRILGGSITFRSEPPGWVPVNGYLGLWRPSQGAPISTIVFDNVYPLPNPNPAPVGGTGWIVEVLARDPDGKILTSVGGNGILVCSDPDCSYKSTSTLFLKPQADGGFYTTNSNGKPADAPSDSAGSPGKRYHNSVSCHAELGDLCEHLGSVVLHSDANHSQTFECTDGECTVAFNP